jgi:hypothetical protein
MSYNMLIEIYEDPNCTIKLNTSNKINCSQLFKTMNLQRLGHFTSCYYYLMQVAVLYLQPRYQVKNRQISYITHHRHPPPVGRMVLPIKIQVENSLTYCIK